MLAISGSYMALIPLNRACRESIWQRKVPADLQVRHSVASHYAHCSERNLYIYFRAVLQVTAMLLYCGRAESAISMRYLLSS
jgi:hypothetical protein